MKKRNAAGVMLALITSTALLAGCGGSTGSAGSAATTGSTSIAAASEEESGTAAANSDYFEITNASDLNIKDTGSYTMNVQSKEGWEFDIKNGTDITSWLVDASGNPAFGDSSGVAVVSEASPTELTVTIDASKIKSFATNGSSDFYMNPKGSNPIVASASNHGQYTDSTALAGHYTIPAVTVKGDVEGTYHADANGEVEPFSFSDDTVTISLSLDGSAVDDSLIDSTSGKIELAPGDGYTLDTYSFKEDSLSTDWKDHAITYTFNADDFSGESWSQLGGDGDGNYYINYSVEGITYNGLPLTQDTFRIHIYCYGRTFTIESNGSLIDDTQPQWTTDTDNGVPVLCDAYTDHLYIGWPVDFDASKLTEDDLTLTLKSEYGDTLKLEAGTDYTITSSTDQTDITLNYIYWANTPVYTKLEVDVATDNLTWDDDMYTVTDISHEYDIASVYAYYVMTGGREGTQNWTYYGIDGLSEWSQVFQTPTYTLSYTDDDGNTFYYAEDENGTASLTADGDEAKKYDDMSVCRLSGNTGSCDRVKDATQDVTVDGTTYTMTKVYNNVDNLPLAPADCTGITAQKGYVIGDSFDMHGRWPWQTFIGIGYKDGSK